MKDQIPCIECGANIEVECIFNNGEVYVCEECGTKNILDWEYISWGNPVAWFVKKEEYLWIYNI